jgi:F0F1-type ATP synthase assembly protein I
MAERGSTQALAIAWSLGWRVAAGILVGYYLDEWLGTSPWLTLVFSLAAFASSVRTMIALTRTREPDRSDRTPPA